MKAIIITIGDELLIGQTVNTNSAWLGSEISLLGFDVPRMISIHDNREDILNILEETTGKYDIALITGGLGPTSDDITKPALCEFFGTRLIPDNEVLMMIETMLKKRGLPLNENNVRQAEVPESCRVLYNAMGTAPGMWFEKGGTVFIAMPGVPYEMKYIMTEHVLPELRSRYHSQVIIHKNVMTYGLSESMLAETLEKFESSLPSEIRLAYLPSFGIIKLRLTAKGTNKTHLTGIINEQLKKLYMILPEYIYGEDEEPLEKVTGNLLRGKNQTIATVESCTGGNLAHMFTSIPGSSCYFKGSLVAYDNRIKTDVLNIPPHILKRYGAVSKQVAGLMASEARKLFKSDYTVATTGIAGPEGGTKTKPVGTIWIAVDSEKGLVTEKKYYGNDRTVNINRFSLAALNLLRKQILRS
ncbi:MAG: competence/damage-inducible protein A [Bacteroidetes bacterium]|jgi:nicotinamide-nucleotide amidase|nr:competence/damage-inducible protein A [Bacteroidota bacterium]